jgi:hypothetical protein
MFRIVAGDMYFVAKHHCYKRKAANSQQIGARIFRNDGRTLRARLAYPCCGCAGYTTSAASSVSLASRWSLPSTRASHAEHFAKSALPQTQRRKCFRFASHHAPYAGARTDIDQGKPANSSLALLVPARKNPHVDCLAVSPHEQRLAIADFAPR